MTVNELGRKVALIAGVTAVIGMGGLTACSSTTKEAPTTTTNSPSSSAAPSNTVSGTPNEKGMDPKNPNSFSPTVKAPPAPTAEPG